MSEEPARPTLRRDLGLPGITIYGVGGMLGGGIYALVGEVAREAGGWSWLSFVVAMAVAAPTALTYAELASRYPRSGGESVFAARAFGRDDVAFLVGWTVIFSGLVSMATLAHAFAGYLQSLAPAVPRAAAVAGFVLGLGVINLRGIRLTSRANVVATVVEASGLMLVIVAGLVFVFGGGGPGGGSAAQPVAAAPAGDAGFSLLGVLQGATLAFYAFIGFEDMVNVAEEVKRPRRHLPVAILVALLSVGLGYAVVNVLATAVVAPPVLADSSAPLERVVAGGLPAFPGAAFTVIALFAVGNSALLNYVMASRLAYGMAGEGLLPNWLSAVHARARVPHRAVLVVGALGMGVALSGTLATLAATTSLLLLAVFLLMHVALMAIKGREAPHPDAFSTPVAVPVAGIVLSAGLAAFGPLESVLAAAGVLIVGGLVWTILVLRR